MPFESKERKKAEEVPEASASRRQKQEESDGLASFFKKKSKSKSLYPLSGGGRSLSAQVQAIGVKLPAVSDSVTGSHHRSASTHAASMSDSDVMNRRFEEGQERKGSLSRFVSSKGARGGGARVPYGAAASREEVPVGANMSGFLKSSGGLVTHSMLFSQSLEKLKAKGLLPRQFDVGLLAPDGTELVLSYSIEQSVVEFLSRNLLQLSNHFEPEVITYGLVSEEADEVLKTKDYLISSRYVRGCLKEKRMPRLVPRPCHEMEQEETGVLEGASMGEVGQQG